MTRADWLVEQDRKRRLAAVGYAAVLYLAVFLAAWGFGLLKRESLADMPLTIFVDLGDFEGPPGGITLGREVAPDRPSEAPLEPPAPPAEKPSAAVTAAPAPAPVPAPAKVAPTQPPAPAADAAAIPAPGPDAVVPQPPALSAPNAPVPAPAAPVPPPEPTSRTFGSPIPTATSAAGVAGGSGSVTFRGSEKGNSLDTTFGASQGSIGRSLYVPIWGYMPLPAGVDAAVYEAIPADKDGFYSAELRKKTFRQYYQDSGGTWTLKAPVPLERRLALWIMLEDSGYDLAQADYKAALKTDRVVLEFDVAPASGSAKPALIDLSLVASSGSPEIDEAVLYGFRQAAFFNKNAFAVSGRFTYRFGK